MNQWWDNTWYNHMDWFSPRFCFLHLCPLSFFRSFFSLTWLLYFIIFYHDDFSKNALECTLKSKALDSAAPNARDPVVVTRRKLGIELELPWTEEMHPFLSFLLEVWHWPLPLVFGPWTICKRVFEEKTTQSPRAEVPSVLNIIAYGYRRKATKYATRQE